LVQAVTDDLLLVPQAALPRVSVILVMFGRSDLALRAIGNLIRNTPACYELIVVDNASLDDSLTVIRSQVAGATIVANEMNLGFSAALSIGALRARGEFLLLLNSDVFVEPGWLPPLLAALDGDRTLAGASPMLLNLDGSVQEAGSMVFSSGDTLPEINHDRWAHEFQRRAPYISAACLLLRRSVYSQLGGFDTEYGRGYFEDVDFALELEALGLGLAHVAGSCARHVRGGSSNHAASLRQTRRNRDLFIERWSDRLALLPHFGPTTVGRVRRGRDSLTADRILVIDERLPHVDRGSGDPRMWQIATTMATTWPSVRVTFLASTLQHSERYSASLLASGVEVAPCGLTEASDWLEQRAGHFSAVFISRPDNVVSFRPHIERTQPQAIVVVDVEALFARRMQRQAALVGETDPAAGRALLAVVDEQRRAEVEGWQWASLITCVCEEEAAEVRAAVPNATVAIVQLVAEAAPTPVPRAERAGAVFFGGFMAGEGSPNADAVRYLIDELMPKLLVEIPELRLTVAGWNPPPSVIQRDGGAVSVIGSVQDPTALLGAHLIHLVPERFGAGIKTKLIESMACGTPFVTSSIGAQGLHLGDLEQHVVADEPARFVELAEALLHDRDLWQSVRDGLLRCARTHFSSEALRSSLVDVMAELGVAPPVPV
jgi:GT2 family glycosyltransferase